MKRGKGFGPIQCKGQRRHFLSYDFEWYPHSLKIRLCGVYDGQRYRYYLTVREFLEGELTSRNRGATFFAHAGGLSDIQFVFEAIVEMGDPDLTVEASFSGSSAVIVRIKRGNNVWVFADSLWILKASLREIGKLIGLVKGNEEEDMSHYYIPLPELIEYNERDCIILYRALRAFEEETLALGGELRLTIASCAMFLFRSAFLRRTIPTHAYINSVARRAYVASRVEVFESAAGPSYFYDINSSFPWSMTFPLPGALLMSTRSLDVPRRSGKPIHSGQPCYLADLTVRVPECYIPPLPLRQEGRVYFPTGEWREWFSSPDIEALSRVPGCEILQVHEVLHFEPFDDMGGYVDALYQKKASATAEGNAFREKTMKFYLNTLYGKFAESPTKEALIIGAEGGECAHSPRCKPDERGMLPCVRMLRPGVFLRVEEVNIPHEWVPIAAHVTSRSRLAHLDLLLAAKRPYYGDTDCVVMPQELGPLPTSPALGALKLQDTIDSAFFLAPKLYCVSPSRPDTAAIQKRMISKGETESQATEALLAPVVRAKGFRRMTPGEFESLAAGDPIAIGRMMRAREMLSSPSATPRDVHFWKSLRNVNRPKRAPVDEIHTRPWLVEELSQPWKPKEKRT